jgi:hypothetical protein
MGTRYFLHNVTCPKCGVTEYEVYYAPTCGISEWVCWCGHKIDLEEYTGISYEDASNDAEIRSIILRMEERSNEANR